MKKLFYLCFAILIACHGLSAQVMNWKNYANCNTIIRMLNTPDYLWLATDGGLVRVNKKTEEFQWYNRANAGLPDNHLASIIQDMDGYIWVGSKYSSIGKFDGDTCEISEEMKYMLNNFVLFADSAGWIWSGTNYGLVGYDREHVYRWMSADTEIASYWMITQLLMDRNKKEMWVGGSFLGYSLLKFDGTSLTPMFKETIRDEITSLTYDKQENLWISTLGEGIFKYSPDGTLTSYNMSNSLLPNDIVQDFKCDSEGTYWLAYSNRLVKSDGTNYTVFETPLITTEGNNFIYSLIPDEGGVIWIATKNQGLFKFTNGEFSKVVINASPIKYNQMGYSMCLDGNGNLWNGTQNDLIKIDSKNNWHSMLEGKINESIGTLRISSVGCDKKNDVWVALSNSDTCIVRISPDGTTKVFSRSMFPYLTSGIIRESSFTVDSDNNVWWGTYYALYKYDGSKWTHYTSNNSPLPCSTITDLAVDSKGNLWGTMNDQFSIGCLFKFDGTNWDIYTKDNSGLPLFRAMCLDIDSQDRVWLHCRANNGSIQPQSGAGLTCFDGNKWIHYNMTNSDIPSNSILDIEIDSKDRIWLGTSGTGLTCFDGKTWQNYNTSNSGIAFNEVSCIQFDNTRNYIWMNHLNYSGMSSVELDNETNVSGTSTDWNNPIIYSNDGKLLCYAKEPVLFEVYDTQAVKVGESTFTNGEAVIHIEKSSNIYLYTVLYPDGQRTSGKIAVK